MAIVPDIQSKITDVDFSVTVIVAVVMMMSSDYLSVRFVFTRALIQPYRHTELSSAILEQSRFLELVLYIYFITEFLKTLFAIRLLRKQGFGYKVCFQSVEGIVDYKDLGGEKRAKGRFIPLFARFLYPGFCAAIFFSRFSIASRRIDLAKEGPTVI